MASTKTKVLYFVSPIYARGEHIIGTHAARNNDGTPNMIRIERGEKRMFDGEIAKDLIIAKQAIDIDASTAKQIRDAEEFVAERLEFEKPKPLKKAA